MAGPRSDTRFPFSELPAALRPREPAETSHSALLWDRYKNHADAGAFASLFEHYAPIAARVAGWLKATHPKRYDDPLDDLISDGLLGIGQGIKLVRLPLAEPSRALWARARWTIQKETLRRRWGGGERFWLTQRPADAIRAELIQQLGRLPTPVEVSGELTGRIANPSLYVEAPRRQFHASSHPDVEREMLTVSHRSDADPSRKAMTRESLRLAARALNPADRKLFRMMMRGLNVAEIARRTGGAPASVARRMNGMLWELRSRSDLASSLGVEAHTGPRPRSGYRDAFISTLPPARRVG